MVEAYIEKNESLIAEFFRENPRLVYDALYALGAEAADTLGHVMSIKPQISLN